ncbi:hypothetical protein [Streptomyces sp. NPDC058657]|uniref:hypothetical protein n=1 Tax=unclassified Streptomyces TaxID=2593676 RepID=UPI003669C428
MTLEAAFNTLLRALASLPDPASVLIAGVVMVLATAHVCGHLVLSLPWARTGEGR